ncbi:MAG: hypothetical protein N2747_09390 [Chitinophagaceae bacterium]|nr:hypothetical protein [Chitinophagaceae bacterium]
MKNLLIIVTALSILSLTLSCEKDKGASIDMKGLWNCNASQNFDSTKLAAKLVGSWKWTTVSCYWSGTTQKANKDVIVTFTSAGTFTVTENGTVTTRGNWKLKIVDRGILGLDLDNPSTFLYGRILLCDNEVLFNHSYIDGCDNLFKRI